MLIKKLVCSIAVGLAALGAFAYETWTDPNTEITWKYTISGGEASVGGGSYNSPAVPTSRTGDITIPSKIGEYPVTSIGSYAFFYCRGLTSVTIPEGVTSVGCCAFYSCSGLTSLTIPSSVTSIGEGTFSGCSGMVEFIVDSENSNYKVNNGLLLSKDGKHLIAGVNVNCDIEIPDGVTSIGGYAFEYCKGLTSVTMPSSVTSIGEQAFYCCGGMIEFVVDEGNPNYKAVDGLLLSKDGAVLIAGVNGDVIVPDGVTSIGEYAFCECSGLKSVTIPSSVTSIGRYAFSGCSGLISIDFEGAPPDGLDDAWINHNDTILYNSLYAEEWSLVIEECGFTNAKSYEPGGKKPDGGPYVEVVDGIFWTYQLSGGEASVSSASPATGDINIPSTLGKCAVTSISDDAFRSCSGLKSVTIPSSVTSIGYCAFYRCSGLTSVTIPEGVTSIGERAFEGCSLVSVSLPASISCINDGIFGYGVTLKKVMFNGEPPPGWAKVIANTATKVSYRKEYESQWKQVTGDVGEESGFICVDSSGSSSSSGSGQISGTIVVSNVVIHYIVNSIQPNLANIVTTDTKFVNVITEIKGGNVAIPDSWAANYPTFAQKFGSDFSKALVKPNGKTDAAGNPMLVWQDYVAGTDPTDENDTFTASVTMVGGKPVVSYSPELSAAEAAKRVYTTYGKAKLQDAEWTVVPEGGEADYNFFKVTVEMK